MQYKTYQEAKIANPASEIYYSAARRLGDKGFYSTMENATGFHHKCKPEDHCMPLDIFLASGERVVKGDVIVGKGGRAITVKAEAENVVNTPVETDCEVYVIKAKALDNPSHEWVNGDECTYNNMDYIFVGMTPTFNNVSCIIFSPKNGIEHVSVRALHKPETPEQKLERQRLESAYHLVCIAAAAGVAGANGSNEIIGEWRGCDFTFDDFKMSGNLVKRWLAVVDETKYLRSQDYE